MGLPVTVYRNTDEGAPQLVDHKPSEVINLLKKCLVEGYGDKLPLGWTVEFEDAANFAVAFRNSTTDGSGGYMKVWSATGADNNDDDFRVQVAKSMSDIDTMFKSTGYRRYNLYKAQQDVGWELIGTSRSFWFMIYTDNGNSSMTYSYNSYYAFSYTPMLFCGDLQCLDPNDDGQFCLLSGSNTTGDQDSTSYSYVIGVNGIPFYVSMYNADGSGDTSVSYASRAPFGYTTAKRVGDPDESGVATFLSQFIINTANDKFEIDVATPGWRALIPGFFQESVSVYAEKVIPFDKTINGQLYSLLPLYYYNNIWVNLESWYD